MIPLNLKNNIIKKITDEKHQAVTNSPTTIGYHKIISFIFPCTYRLFYVFLSISEQNFRLFFYFFLRESYTLFFPQTLFLLCPHKLQITSFFHTPHKGLIGPTSVINLIFIGFQI